MAYDNDGDNPTPAGDSKPSKSRSSRKSSRESSGRSSSEERRAARRAARKETAALLETKGTNPFGDEEEDEAAAKERRRRERRAARELKASQDEKSPRSSSSREKHADIRRSSSSREKTKSSSSSSSVSSKRKSKSRSSSSTKEGKLKDNQSDLLLDSLLDSDGEEETGPVEAKRCIRDKKKSLPTVDEQADEVPPEVSAKPSSTKALLDQSPRSHSKSSSIKESTEKKSEKKTEKKAEKKTEKKVETKAEKKTEKKAEKKAEKKTEKKAEKKTEKKAETKAEKKTEMKAEKKEGKHREKKLQNDDSTLRKTSNKCDISDTRTGTTNPFDDTPAVEEQKESTASDPNNGMSSDKSVRKEIPKKLDKPEAVLNSDLLPKANKESEDKEVPKFNDTTNPFNEEKIEEEENEKPSPTPVISATTEETPAPTKQRVVVKSFDDNRGFFSKPIYRRSFSSNRAPWINPSGRAMEDTIITKAGSGDLGRSLSKETDEKKPQDPSEAEETVEMSESIDGIETNIIQAVPPQLHRNGYEEEEEDDDDLTEESLDETDDEDGFDGICEPILDPQPPMNGKMVEKKAKNGKPSSMRTIETDTSSTACSVTSFTEEASETEDGKETDDNESDADDNESDGSDIVESSRRLLRMVDQRMQYQHATTEMSKLRKQVQQMEDQNAALTEQLRRAIDTKCDLVLAQTELERMHENQVMALEDEMFDMRRYTQEILDQSAVSELNFMNEIHRLTQRVNDMDRKHKNQILEKDYEIAQLEMQVERIKTESVRSDSRTAFKSRFLPQDEDVPSVECV